QKALCHNPKCLHPSAQKGFRAVDMGSEKPGSFRLSHYWSLVVCPSFRNRLDYRKCGVGLLTFVGPANAARNIAIELAAKFVQVVIQELKSGVLDSIDNLIVTAALGKCCFL
ncbi:MAG TPA: hypothetical protein VJ728_17985, partial [Candidatus Binataceae bacterium]|nr:hypothetical protein [Candidatus Binataceae bacterium]